jgi:hypothetical protein
VKLGTHLDTQGAKFRIERKSLYSERVSRFSRFSRFSHFLSGGCDSKKQKNAIFYNEKSALESVNAGDRIISRLFDQGGAIPHLRLLVLSPVFPPDRVERDFGKVIFKHGAHYGVPRFFIANLPESLKNRA